MEQRYYICLATGTLCLMSFGWYRLADLEETGKAKGLSVELNRASQSKARTDGEILSATERSRMLLNIPTVLLGMVTMFFAVS